MTVTVPDTDRLRTVLDELRDALDELKRDLAAFAAALEATDDSADVPPAAEGPPP